MRKSVAARNFSGSVKYELNAMQRNSSDRYWRGTTERLRDEDTDRTE